MGTLASRFRGACEAGAGPVVRVSIVTRWNPLTRRQYRAYHCPGCWVLDGVPVGPSPERDLARVNEGRRAAGLPVCVLR